MSNEEQGGTVTTSDEPSTATCPVLNAAHQAVGTTANQHWWPDSLNLRILRQNHPGSDPLGEDFDYAAEFNSLDFDALAADVDCAVGPAPCLAPSDDHGFAIDEAEVIYSGLCPECAASNSTP